MLKFYFLILFSFLCLFHDINGSEDIDLQTLVDALFDETETEYSIFSKESKDDKNYLLIKQVNHDKAHGVVTNQLKKSKTDLVVIITSDKDTQIRKLSVKKIHSGLSFDDKPCIGEVCRITQGIVLLFTLLKSKSILRIYKDGDMFNALFYDYEEIYSTDRKEKDAKASDFFLLLQNVPSKDLVEASRNIAKLVHDPSLFESHNCNDKHAICNMYKETEISSHKDVKIYQRKFDNQKFGEISLFQSDGIDTSHPLHELESHLLEEPRINNMEYIIIPKEYNVPKSFSKSSIINAFSVIGPQEIKHIIRYILSGGSPLVVRIQVQSQRMRVVFHYIEKDKNIKKKKKKSKKAAFKKEAFEEAISTLSAAERLESKKREEAEKPKVCIQQ